MNGRLLLALVLVMTAFAGCTDAGGDGMVGEEGAEGTDTASTTVDDSHQNGGPRGYLPETISGLEYVTTAVDTNARGIWVNDDVVYASGTPGLRIIDVTDPANPVVLASDVPDTDGGGSRDVDFMKHPNGRDYVTMSRNGIVLVDVTEPTEAAVVSQAASSSHNMAVVPGTTLVYNSLSIYAGNPNEDGRPEGTVGKIDIVDFADPANPVVAEFWFPATIMTPGGVPKDVEATTCHDITFTMENNRAYCAGVSETHIWDISDPANPVIIQVVKWAGNQIHHGAWGASDGNILIIGDEFAGAGGGVCTTSQDPYASLWFFDISDIETPTPLGYHRVDYNSIPDIVTDEDFQDDPRENALCTTHFGTLVEDRDLFVLGWYVGGVTLVDFSDPSNPVQLGHYKSEESTSVWDARYYKGHVYTGDSRLGVEVLKVI